MHDSSPCGFPHSDIPGSTLIYSSPRLIAVNHVLLRLLMPRHSSYALLSLNNPCSPCLSFDNLFGLLNFEKASLFISSTISGEIVVNLNFSYRPTSLRLSPSPYRLGLKTSLSSSSSLIRKNSSFLLNYLFVSSSIRFSMNIFVIGEF